MSDQDNRDLSTELIKTNDPAEAEQIINLVNSNIKKRAVIRADKMSQLQDKITVEIANRIEKRSGEFSNQDLLSYMNTLQTLIDKTDKSPEVPMIAIQKNNTININSDVLDKESRDRVKNVIDMILKDKEITDG